MYELQLFQRLLIVGEHQANLLPVVEEVLFKQRQDALVENVPQCSHALYAFLSVPEWNKVGVADEVVTAIQRFNALVHG
ncbi:hypothetical protein D3C71_1312340 [compost metagenome]